MLDALCEHLLEKPGLYLDEMELFLWDEFEVSVSTSSSTAIEKLMARHPGTKNLTNHC
jgi:hypothetical protein